MSPNRRLRHSRATHLRMSSTPVASSGFRLDSLAPVRVELGLTFQKARMAFRHPRLRPASGPAPAAPLREAPGGAALGRSPQARPMKSIVCSNVQNRARDYLVDQFILTYPGALLRVSLSCRPFRGSLGSLTWEGGNARNSPSSADSGLRQLPKPL